MFPIPNCTYDYLSLSSSIAELKSYDPLCGYDCSPQAGSGTWAKAQPYHSLHLNVGYSLNC